jgi:CRP-like cAMP-binding protein/rhodanese-related sulfurtransferase
MAETVDKALLQSLLPPAGLNADKFLELSGKGKIEIIPSGKTLFKQGEADRKTIYLIEGSLNLNSDKGTTKVAGGTDAAKQPIANQQPRLQSAMAASACKIAIFDSDLLDIMLTWDQLSGIEVADIADDEEEDDSDWMTRILQSQAFLQVPPANIQAMFMRMQEVSARSGDVVIKQGDEGDYYYILKSGKAKVSRTSKTGSELTLAQLGDGDAFGEEALLSEAKRNATISMTTDGSLMRLSKDDFNALLKEPMLSWVTYEEGVEKVSEGAVWLDVRLEKEHQESGIDGAENIPLFMLRMKTDLLDMDTSYVLYSDTGRRSSAAAFLLSERGFHTYVLKGGLVERAAGAE